MENFHEKFRKKIFDLARTPSEFTAVVSLDITVAGLNMTGLRNYFEIIDKSLSKLTKHGVSRRGVDESHCVKVKVEQAVKSQELGRVFVMRGKV